VLTVSPYKIFGPHLGILVGSPAALDGWEPYRVRPAEHYPSPMRWETGTPNHEGLAGFIAAVDYLAEVGRAHGAPRDRSRAAAVRAAFDVFGEHERALAAAFLTGLDKIEAARLYGIADPARSRERTPTFALRLGEQPPVDTATRLGERGIYVWDGHYYAMELFERLGILDSGGAVRVGFCHYHTRDEVDRVLEALDELAAAP
jgi:selenocysteine lyase/cysteine desulfurase